MPTNCGSRGYLVRWTAFAEFNREGRKQRRDDEDDEYDGPRDELRYAAVQLGLSAAVLGIARRLISRVSRGRTSPKLRQLNG